MGNKSNKAMLDDRNLTEEDSTYEEKTKKKITMDPKKMNILALGDSLTAGFHHRGFEHSPYTDTLAKFLAEAGIDAEIFNYGVDGEYTKGMLKTANSLFEENKFDYMILLGGTNDMGLRNAEMVLTNLNAIHDLARSKGTKTFAVTIPESGQDERVSWLVPLRDTVNNKLREQYAGSLIDLNKELPYLSLSAEDQKIYWDDTLHFTKAGYVKVGEIIWNAIKDKLNK